MNYLQAMPGSGKSLLLHRLALLWACGHDSLHPYFNCALLVRLGDISNSSTLVQYLQENKIYEKSLNTAGQWRPRTLLLLDAYDEAPGAIRFLSAIGLVAISVVFTVISESLQLR